MIYATIGLFVGVIMGITGAGGAMISIPLFINLTGTSLKEATVLSLVAVVFGTAVNLIGRVFEVNKKIAISMSVAGAISNYYSLPLKEIVSEIFIAALLTVIGVYSIWSVWSGKRNTQTLKEENNVLSKAVIAGAFLGLMTTLTGLGGGVILVPILINVFGKTYEEALPTSLGTILLISLTAFIFQFKTAFFLISFTQLALLAAGALIAYGLLKVLLKKMTETKLLLLRRTVFTTVTIYSVVSVIIKVI